MGVHCVGSFISIGLGLWVVKVFCCFCCLAGVTWVYIVLYCNYERTVLWIYICRIAPELEPLDIWE